MSLQDFKDKSVYKEEPDVQYKTWIAYIRGKYYIIHSTTKGRAFDMVDKILSAGDSLFHLSCDRRNVLRVDKNTAAALISEVRVLDNNTRMGPGWPSGLEDPRFKYKKDIGETEATNIIEYHLARKYKSMILLRNNNNHIIKSGEIEVKNKTSPYNSRPFRADIVCARETWFNHRRRGEGSAPYLCVEVKGKGDHRRGLGEAMAFKCHSPLSGFACIDMDISVQKAISDSEIKGWNIVHTGENWTVKEV